MFGTLAIQCKATKKQTNKQKKKKTNRMRNLYIIMYKITGLIEGCIFHCHVERHTFVRSIHASHIDMSLIRLFLFLCLIELFVLVNKQINTVK